MLYDLVFAERALVEKSSRPKAMSLEKVDVIGRLETTKVNAQIVHQFANDWPKLVGCLQ